jgi:hypothetical protein
MVMKGGDGEKPLLPCLEAVAGWDWLSTFHLWNPSPHGSVFFCRYPSAVMFLREMDKVEEKQPYTHGQTNTISLPRLPGLSSSLPENHLLTTLERLSSNSAYPTQLTSSVS